MRWTQLPMLLAAVTVAAVAGRLLLPVREVRPPPPPGPDRIAEIAAAVAGLSSRVSRLESRVEVLEAALGTAPACGPSPASPAAAVDDRSGGGGPLPAAVEGIEEVLERYPPPVSARIKEVVARFSLGEIEDLQAAADYVEEIEGNHDLRLDDAHLDAFWPVFLGWRKATVPLMRRCREAEEASLAWRCTEAERPGLQARVREIEGEISAVFVQYKADAHRLLPAEVWRQLFE